MKSDNIFFFITAFGHGKGGHFYSLKTISEALSNNMNCRIISIGPAFSPVIKNIDKIPVKHFEYRIYNHLAVICQINKYVKAELRKNNGRTIFHSFDENSFAFARIISHHNKFHSVLTKCGGPNPTKYFPNCQNMILFSKENYDFFEDKYRHKINLGLIPNRTQKIHSDTRRIKRLKHFIKLPKGYLTLIRIGRFDRHYESSIKQSIELHKALRNVLPNIALIMIGVVQDETLLNEITNGISKDVFIINDDEFTYNASELIDIADVVIGTGRGLMEASSLGKIILTPNSNSKLPILVDKNTFPSILQTNFSPRNKVLVNDQLTIKRIIEITNNIELRKKYSKMITDLYQEYFSVEVGVLKYINFYKDLRIDNKLRLMDVVLNNLIFFIRAIKKYAAK